MKKLTFYFFGCSILIRTTLCYGQASTPCNDIALGMWCYDAAAMNGQGDATEYAITGTSAWETNSDHHVVKIRGEWPITICYTTPDMSRHSTFNNCIKQADVDNCVANDLEQWISICPGVFTPNKIDARNGTTGNCAQDGSNSVLFLINWETNTNAFSTGKDQKGNSTIAAGSTTPHWFYGNTQFGYPILNLATIDLNNTKTFNDAFVFTTCPQHCTIIKPQKPASLCEVILHELGHAFGLDDLRSKASGGQNYPWGVMWGELDDGQLGCPDKQLQDIDQCYFCKLYCPDFGACQSLSAPLPVGDTSMSIAVFPNPATSSFTIVYKTQSEHPRLLIEDINGRTIKKENLSGNAGSLDVKRDQLPAGAYILKLQAGSYFIVRLLILQ